MIFKLIKNKTTQKNHTQTKRREEISQVKMFNPNL